MGEATNFSSNPIPAVRLKSPPTFPKLVGGLDFLRLQVLCLESFFLNVNQYDQY
jgi:hypothetical protein